jgi:hypothetical protein
VQLNSFLVPANNTYGLKIIFDKSGWPIIVSGDYSKWYSINSKQYGWIDITEDEKNKLGLINAKSGKLVVSTDPNDPSSWPMISLDELPKYREELKKYVEKNLVFSEDVFQNIGQYLLNKANEYFTRIIFDYRHFLIDAYRQFPERIPRKTFAFAILEWQIPGTKVERSILLSQLWLDEENEPSIILNYFIPCQTSDCTEKFVDYYPYIESGFYEPMPLYFSANDESDGYIFSDLDEVEQSLVRQKNSEILKVDDLFNKWIEEQRMPKELEGKLLYTKIWTIVE